MSKASERADALMQSLTDKMVSAIEDGAGEWRMPWQTMIGAGTPVSVDKRAYRGFNALWLGMLAVEQGYGSGVWATYNAWKRNGAQVQKGEKGTDVLLWKQATGRTRIDDKTGESVRPRYLLARTFTVHAAEQCGGTADALVERIRGGLTGLDPAERHAAADAYFKGYECEIREGGNSAFYHPFADEIHVPTFEQFEDPEAFYSTVAHEAVHSTGHKSRLDRTFGARFGDEAYAVEELTAELGAAYWCAQAGISQAPRPDHAAYLSHWLSVLRADPKALVTVTSKAQAAVDYLNAHTSAPMMMDAPSAAPMVAA